ncbi:nuclear transport factor 2 family protein [Lentzea sp. NPDC059081]|uniref:nuclear transport factor 2 family protein n=1 Tax=Lentzea sp. NPDC059081 TaxID=3346719 RepID=UPI0036CC4DC0
MSTTPAFTSLPDSDIATAALRLTESRLPEFVVGHCVRGFLFGRELAARDGLLAGRDYDDELLFLCNVLHDLGLAAGAEENPDRFEVHGADEAVAFARAAGLAEDKLPVLWDAVALHTSIGIANRKQPEVAITQLGASTDVAGVGLDRLPADLVDVVHELYPRHDLGYALPDLIIEQARANPAKAGPLTYPGHLLNLHVPLGTSSSWFDVLAGAPWGDRPVSETSREGAVSPEELAAEFSRRLARGDVDGLTALYDPNAIFVPSPGSVARGRDEIRAAFADLVGSGTTVDLELLSSHVSADQALVTHKATIRSAGSDQVVVTTEVLRRRADGRWVYLVDDPFFGASH